MFIDLRFYESRETVVAKCKTKVIANKSDRLLTVVKKGVEELLRIEGNDATDDAINAAIGRIQAITTNNSDPVASDLLKFLEVNEATLDALNSNDTPILKEGIDIHLPNDIESVVDAPSSKRQKVESSDECANNAITDCIFNSTNECPVCSEELFDENGKADKAVAEILCDHLVHSDCLAQVGRDLNSDGKRYGMGGLGPRTGCPVCEKPVSMWHAYNNACDFKGFWTQRIENALKELGPPANARGVSGEALRSKLKEDPQLTKKQKKMISFNRESGFSECLKEGGRVDYTNPGAMFAGFLFSRGKWKYNSNDDTLWLWEWGLQRPSSRCAYCGSQRTGLTVCADCKDSSEAPMYCCDECQQNDKRYHSENCGAFQIMKLGQEQGCTGAELLQRLRERSR